MAGRLTAKQRRFLEQLHAFITREGAPPTVREMQAIGGFRSPRSVAQYLEVLERAGYVRRGRGARNVRVVREPPPRGTDDRAKTIDVPIVGHVPAGAAVLATENLEGHAKVGLSLARPGYTYFLLRVHGNSMDLAGIDDGDLVLVRQQATARSGDVVVALIDNEVTVKRLHLGSDVAVLKPESTCTTHRPIIVDAEFRIQGLVIAALPGATQDDDGSAPPSNGSKTNERSEELDGVPNGESGH